MAKGGLFVQYSRRDGTTQKGLVKNNEQEEAFRRAHKRLVRLLNDDLTQKTDENGKGMISLVHEDRIKIIGFFD